MNFDFLKWSNKQELEKIKEHGYPDLPEWVVSEEGWFKHGEFYYVFAKDGRYQLLFEWDGISCSFNRVNIEIDWEYEESTKDEVIN